MYAKTIKRTLIVLFFTSIGILFAYVLPTVAQSVTQSYTSDVPLQRGMIVGLKKDDLRKVEPVNYDQFDRIMGVVIGANDTSILLGKDWSHWRTTKSLQVFL